MIWKGLLAATAAFVVGTAAQASIVSYNASSGSPPAGSFARFDADNFFSTFFLSPYFQKGFNASQAVGSGVLSTGPTDQAKYTFYYYAGADFPLDHTGTVEVKATLKLGSQSSVNIADRAGLAIGLTDDQGLYSELYINENEIFLNKAGRVRDVAYAMDTVAAFHDYTLRLQGSTIQVDVDGITRLTGSTFVASGVLADWATVGDITSSASSSYQMTQFSVSAVAPEPASMGLLAVGAGLLMRRRR